MLLWYILDHFKWLILSWMVIFFLTNGNNESSVGFIITCVLERKASCLLLELLILAAHQFLFIPWIHKQPWGLNKSQFISYFNVQMLWNVSLLFKNQNKQKVFIWELSRAWRSYWGRAKEVDLNYPQILPSLFVESWPSPCKTNIE